MVQVFTGHSGVLMPNNRIRKGVHQENAAGFLQLGPADNFGDRVQIEVCCGNAAHSSAAGLQHAGNSDYIRLGVFVQINIAEGEILRLQALPIPGF